MTGSGEKRKFLQRKRRKNFITVTFPVKKIVIATAKIFYHCHRKKNIFLYFLKENSSKFFLIAYGAPVIIQAVRQRCQKISEKAS